MSSGISVHLAVNDRNGNKTGDVAAIQVFEDTDPTDPLLSLEPRFDGPPCFIYGNCLEIEGHRWPISWHGSYVGSIIYDAVGMTEQAARKMAAQLLRDGWTADQWCDAQGWELEKLIEASKEYDPFKDPTQCAMELKAIG